MVSKRRNVSSRRSSVRSPRPGRPPFAAIPVVVALTVAGCGGDGGGDGGGGAPAVNAGNDLIVGGSADGRAASEIDEEQLRRNALARASAGLGVNIGSLRDVIADGDDDVVTGSPGADGAPVRPTPDPDESPGDDLLGTLDDGSDDFLRRTLGVDDPNARVTREGDVITIDPDDAALCSDDPAVDHDDGLVLDDEGSNADCLALVADLSVTVDARTEQSGVIGYRFEREPLLSIGYSPSGATFELSLDGVGRVVRRLETIGGVEPSGLVLAGALRLAARVLDDTPGRESGEIELSVTEALELGEVDSEAGLTLGPSRVLMIGVDGATGTVAASVAWGALRSITESGDSDGNRSLTTLDLGGLTLDVDAAADGTSSAVSVRNVGIGDVPLNIRVGSTDALTLALETFGVTIDGEDGVVTFDTAAGVELVLDNLGGAFEEMASDYRARFTASAPAGTALAERAEGVFEITGGGPLEASVDASDGAGSTQSAIGAGVGSCIGTEELAALGTPPASEPTDAERLVDGLAFAELACP